MFLSWKSPGPPLSTPSAQPSLEGAIAFWAGKDPLERYDWSKADICACGQYSKHLGDKTWMKRTGHIELWSQLNAVAAHEPRTFGALVERAKNGRKYSLV